MTQSCGMPHACIWQEAVQVWWLAEPQHNHVRGKQRGVGKGGRGGGKVAGPWRPARQAAAGNAERGRGRAGSPASSPLPGPAVCREPCRGWRLQALAQSVPEACLFPSFFRDAGTVGGGGVRDLAVPCAAAAGTSSASAGLCQLCQLCVLRPAIITRTAPFLLSVRMSGAVASNALQAPPPGPPYRAASAPTLLSPTHSP